MTARELLETTLNTAGFQITRIFEGLPSESWNLLVTPEGMTPTGIAQHLCECYHAFSEIADGRKHEWGSYKVGSDKPEDLIEAMKTKRGAAVSAALNSTDEKVVKESVEYLALHDAYHVGQLSLLRLRTEPDWDPYSLYE